MGLEKNMVIRKKKHFWQDKVVDPAKALAQINPGMSIFLTTGVAEPRTLVRHLLESDKNNLQDLELIQLVSLGDALPSEHIGDHKFRLKTFFSGWVAGEAITRGHVDLIPARFTEVPDLLCSERIPVDVAFVQITQPDEAGYASLGVSVDVARQAMDRACIVVGEIQPEMPRTWGDTFVHVDDFQYLVQSEDKPLVFPRARVDAVFDKVAANVSALVEDGSCMAFSMEPLFEALWPHLARKKDLGVDSAFFSDPLMDLVKSGAVSNRRKGSFRGKCLTSYALGSQELMNWLHENPLVEFQAVDVVGSPERIRRNSRFMAILPTRRVTLTGQIAFPAGRGNLGIGPAVANEFIAAASMSEGGRVIIALPSRNRKGDPNIVVGLGDLPNQYNNPESIDFVVTEYGVASMVGKTVRERAMALIDIAHPDDRSLLVEQAREKNILYADQLYLAESGRLYPHDIDETATFKDGLQVRFRPIKPSDEDGMRRLFYRFSREAVYYRYFSPIKTMPHHKMQEYVNVDYNRAMGIVGFAGDSGDAQMVAEARYVKLADRPWADVAFVVDEDFGGKGIATYLFGMLIRIARDRGVEGFTADVLSTNKAMLKVFEKSPYPVEAKLESGIYHLEIPFNWKVPNRSDGITFVSSR